MQRAGASRRVGLVLRLGTAQTLAWASSYYLPAFLAAAIARELQVTSALVFAAFSAALVVSALLGPRAGRLIDRQGGRPVLAGTSLLFATGLGMLAMAQGPISLFAAWLVLGVAMGAGLYDAAFAALVRLHGRDARGTITGITLIAGFASTVGWPITVLLEETLGWRGACWCWAGLHLALGLPLNLSLPRHAPAPAPAGSHSFQDENNRAAAAAGGLPGAPADAAAAQAATQAPQLVAAQAAPQRHNTPAEVSTDHPLLASVLLALVFAIGWFISTALGAHLPRLLQLGGLSLADALWLGMLIGPAQVAGRVLEFSLLRHVHPLLSARLATAAHPLGVAGLILFGAPAAMLFIVLHGAGNGILTITKGTLPLAVFGALNYGARQGWLSAPARLSQAFAPVLFGLAIDAWGTGALYLSAALGLGACGALWVLKGTLRTH